MSERPLPAKPPLGGWNNDEDFCERRDAREYWREQLAAEQEHTDTAPRFEAVSEDEYASYMLAEQEQIAAEWEAYKERERERWLRIGLSEQEVENIYF